MPKSSQLISAAVISELYRSDIPVYKLDLLAWYSEQGFPLQCILKASRSLCSLTDETLKISCVIIGLCRDEAVRRRLLRNNPSYLERI